MLESYSLWVSVGSTAQVWRTEVLAQNNCDLKPSVSVNSIYYLYKIRLIIVCYKYDHM